jgi:hypothetical protein
MAEVTPHIPAAPKHLPDEVQDKWTRTYKRELESARLSHPDSTDRQHAEARKAANKMLAVPPPEDVEDIDDLEDWQFLHRGTRKIKGVDHRFVVTSDGRKYAHPIATKKPEPKKLEPKPNSSKGKSKDASTDAPDTSAATDSSESSESSAA